MPDLAKLANLSKRLKTSPKTDHGDESNLAKPIGSATAEADDDGPEEAPAPRAATSGRAAPVATAPVAASGGGGGPVSVHIDLGPVASMLSKLNDNVAEVAAELRRIREKGAKIGFAEDTAEQFDQMLKHVSAGSKANRELAEKVVTSLPDSRWYGDLQELLRAIGENMAAGGGGGGGGSSEDITQIKEQLEMQKTQLSAILSIIQRRQ
ncbi:MAG: hypothetical protein IT462_06350 [Planctomycetes bacterium]|nr:hypothetical protein [Planctomycetota bacterium]